MTSGIYQLTFSNGMRYIGKSVDIERRWKEHTNNFINKKAAAKLQTQYNQRGHPRAEVLLYCHKDHLDILEVYTIATRRPELNTVEELPISDDDYKALMQQSQLLEESTVEHIKLISALADHISDLEEQAKQQDAYIVELEKDVELEKLSVDAYESFVNERQAHLETKRKHDEYVKFINDLLVTEQNKTWWQRLLGK